MGQAEKPVPTQSWWLLTTDPVISKAGRQAAALPTGSQAAWGLTLSLPTSGVPASPSGGGSWQMLVLELGWGKALL